MLRITPLQQDTKVARLQIEGRITQQTAAELRSSCTERLSAPQTLLLDLSGVPFVDADGVAALHGLVEKGTVLIGCSGFLTELLHLNGAEEKTMQAPAQADDTLDESQLLQGLRSGDGAAFEQVVRQYSSRLLAVARRMLGNEHDAQDALQEAFLSAFKAIEEFSGAAKLSTWLHRIVVNAALMKLRSRRRKREETIDELLPRFDAEGEWASEVTGWETPSEVLLQQQETRAMVRRCIDQLPESYRTVLLLRDIEELDTEEAADALGVTPNAVKIRLHRARQALRTLLERNWPACHLRRDLSRRARCARRSMARETRPTKKGITMSVRIVTDKHVDGFRFAGPAARILQQSIPTAQQYDWIPWTPLTKPLGACRFSLLTTAGISLRTDAPFDMTREQQEPTWGDPSFRRIPSSATINEVDINHLHINTAYAAQDLNVVLPLQRFQELEQSGEIGSLAPTCYSLMGFNTDPTELVCDSAPKIAEGMRAKGMDAAFLVPV